MSSIAIRLDGLSKRYRIGTAQQPIGRSAREALAHLAGAPLRNLKRLRQLSTFQEESAGDDVLWALSDITFDVKHGEVVGLLGGNGAGKSTLLKILSRITPPTRGEASVFGRVGSLLEVGTGFHPELSGRDNVFLNGSILGMDKAEIARRFDEIVEFAGVSKFIDTPVKRYSSGMYVRLAFAVAAHLEPEILIVDEVLSVGDAEFQRKCLGKMGKVSGEGRTVLFVSHNLVAVQGLCSRAVWLRNGRVAMDGGTEAVIADYVRQSGTATSQVRWAAPEQPVGDAEIQLLWAHVRPEEGAPGDLIDVHTPLVLEFAFRSGIEGLAVRPRIHMVNQERLPVFKSGPPEHPTLARGEEAHFRCRIPGDLLNDGKYTINLRFVREDLTLALRKDDLLSFEVADSPAHRGNFFGQWGGVIRPMLDWSADTGSGRWNALDSGTRNAVGIS